MAELKTRAAPISYSETVVNRDGELEGGETFAQKLEKRVICGYGAVWGSRNTYGEIFYRGAFARSIADNGPDSKAAYKIKFRDEHGRAMALMAVLKEDEIGLYFETAPLDNVPWADHVIEQLRSGTLNNFSIGFNYIFDQSAMWYDEESDSIHITQAKLLEVSSVSVPSDMQTYAMRSAEAEEPGSLFEETENFILQLPKNMQLQARKLITRHIALHDVQPTPPITVKPAAEQHPPAAIDYNYLLNNF